MSVELYCTFNRGLYHRALARGGCPQRFALLNRAGPTTNGGPPPRRASRELHRAGAPRQIESFSYSGSKPVGPRSHSIPVSSPHPPYPRPSRLLFTIFSTSPPSKEYPRVSGLTYTRPNPPARKGSLGDCLSKEVRGWVVQNVWNLMLGRHELCHLHDKVLGQIAEVERAG